MRLIESIINKLTKKINNHDLYYGYIYQTPNTTSTNENSPVTRIEVTNSDNFVIMQKLTKRERNSYLKSKFNTFIDSDNSEISKYITIKNSDIDYYRVPSLNNAIIPQIQSTTELGLVSSNLITLQTCYLYDDINIEDKYVSLDKIKEYEHQLNQNKQLTSYYNPKQTDDHDFRKYYE